MGRITFAQVNNLPDALDSNAYEMLFGTIPGYGLTSDLTVKCQTVSIPGFSNEAWETNLHGYVVKNRGRKMFARTLSATFTEHADGSTLKAFKVWDEYIAGSKSGNSQGFKKGPDGYSVQSALRVYNTIGALANEVEFVNMFLQEISDVNLDSSSSQQMLVSATFSFDQIMWGGIPLL